MVERSEGQDSERDARADELIGHRADSAVASARGDHVRARRDRVADDLRKGLRSRANFDDALNLIITAVVVKGLTQGLALDVDS